MKYPVFLMSGILTLALAGAPALAQQQSGKSHPRQEQVALKADKASKVVYQCPMDTEVVSAKAGSCSKCGMKLEKKTVSMADAEGTSGTSAAPKQAAHGKPACCPNKSAAADSACAGTCKD